MIGVNSSDYYRRRAAQAHRLAMAAIMPEVRLIHLVMAERYVELAREEDGPVVRPRLELAV